MNRSQDKGLAKHDFSSVKMHTFFSLTLQSASLMVIFYAKLMGFDVCAFVSRTQKSNQRQRVSTNLSTSKSIFLSTIHLALITSALDFELLANIIAIFLSNQSGIITK